MTVCDCGKHPHASWCVSRSAPRRTVWEIRAAGNDALLDRVEAESEMEALVAYGRGLPAAVTVEAGADGSLLGRLARYVVYACSKPSAEAEAARVEMLARQKRRRPR